jgi:UDP-3-O-[3-hydroxymyristoyl] N-acetylglucosamine deacetylase/3-hydroxyacyl-[acyl-carrier-protein] dehydratase
MSSGEDGAQRTLGGTAARSGVGLHSGEDVRAVIAPAEAGTGVVFRRTDLEDAPPIPATLDHVTGVEWETVLGRDGVEVRTVEHVLAALAALEVDNAEVRVDGPEPPALDGSAGPWCDAIHEAGVEEQGEPAEVFGLDEPVSLDEGESSYTVLPYDGLRVSAEIDFEHPAIGRQFASALGTGEAFRREVAPARTFGLEGWKDRLRERGLARGATRENTIVVGPGDGAGDMDLRFPDEFVRHKITDVVGDLALLGRRFRGHVVARRPGHRGNIALARRLLREAEGRARGDDGEDAGPVLDIHDILEYMPHRYPLLLVDRVVEFEAGERIVGLKNVTINEPFFTGHFPEHPIMPGVLVVEAMAQAGGLLLMNEFDDPESKVVYLMSLDGVKFRRPVVPGDSLYFELRMTHFRGRVCRMQGVGRVDGDVVTEAELLARIMDR